MNDPPQRLVTIQWTTTAKEALRGLPKKVAKGLLDKAEELYKCEDPKTAHKPLTGPLKGNYRITYARYRAVYSVEEEDIANGDVFVHIRVLFVAAGIRKERSKKDVYAVAQKIVELGVVNIDPVD